KSMATVTYDLAFNAQFQQLNKVIQQIDEVGPVLAAFPDGSWFTAFQQLHGPFVEFDTLYSVIHKYDGSVLVESASPLNGLTQFDGANHVQVATLLNGNIVVTWDGVIQSFSRVHASVIAPSGQTVVPDFQVLGSPDLGTINQAGVVVGLSDGNFVVVYHNTRL